MRVPIQLHAGMSELAARISDRAREYAGEYFSQYGTSLMLQVQGGVDPDEIAEGIREHVDSNAIAYGLAEADGVPGAVETYESAFQLRLEQLIGEKLGE
jgi:hypothetical protein